MKELKIKNRDRLAIVDDEDYDRLVNFNWRASTEWGGIQTHSSIKDSTRKSGWKTISCSLASMIMNKHGVLFDHINRDGFDNRKQNLRECSIAQNGMNHSKRIDGRSNYVGVVWFRPQRKWRARIKLSGKEYHLGYFHNEKEAASAYNKKAFELFKEFANLNKDENGVVL